MYVALLFASAAIFIVVVAAYIRKPFASVFHPISFYLMFHGFVFVIRPFFLHWQEYRTIYTSFMFTPSPDAKAAAILVANIGLLAFVAGAWRTGATVLPFPQERVDLEQRERLIGPFLVVAAVQSQQPSVQRISGRVRFPDVEISGLKADTACP